MSRRRILIVTNGQLSRNPRPWKEAQTLGSAGFDVTVLMVRNHAESERHDAALTNGAPFRRECVDFLPGFAASPSRLFIERARFAFARRFQRQSIHALGPADALLARARQFPADLTIVHNEVPHWVGLQLRRTGRAIAADIEDWHSEDLLPTERARRPLALLRTNERALLHEAAYTSTTSHALAGALQARYGGRRPMVISNSFPLQPNPRAGAPAEPPSFLWFSQTLGSGRGLEPFIAAWRRTERPSRVVLLGAPIPGYLERLLAGVTATQRQNVTVLPLVPPNELPDVIARHDIGLALEESAIPSRNLTITNKILQYLNAGLPVVATDTAGQREVLARATNAGWLVSLADTDRLARQLDDTLADHARLAVMSAAARRAAEEIYCWEKEAPQLLAGVETALDQIAMSASS